MGRVLYSLLHTKARLLFQGKISLEQLLKFQAEQISLSMEHYFYVKGQLTNNPAGYSSWVNNRHFLISRKIVDNI
jgi:hypothetical protein